MSVGRRLAYVSLLGALRTLAYFVLNHHPPRPSSALPLTAFETALPFLPATVWLYFALLACEIVLPLLVRSRDEFRRLLIGYTVAMSIAFATYALSPTHYARPTPPAADTVTGWAYGILIGLDTPECCLPSGHVIVPALAAWSVFRDRDRVWPIAVIAFLVPSVLTTKQHYLWDVLAGLALAVIAVLAARRLAPERHPIREGRYDGRDHSPRAD